MLRKTFIHLDGVGTATERKLWRRGIHDCDELLAHGLEYLPALRRPAVRSGVCESISCYVAGNWAFFEQRLPPSQKWRAYHDLGGKALFLDIETTGLNETDSITMIGTYNGSESKTFVAGSNLEQAVAEINRYPLLVTFNGTCFDLPVIRRRFPDISGNHIHIDLRYSLRALGYRGGLKAIEKQLGFERSSETRGLSGWDAVRLWNEHLNGSREALALLVKYNAEDVRSLKMLLETVWRLSVGKIGLPE
jgi:hypothetical protein